MAIRRKGMVALFAMVFSAGLSAHHAMEVHYVVSDEAIFEKEGVVKNFSLLDPHSYLVVTVEEEGQRTDWVLEGRSREALTRAGWRFDMFKPGATVRFTAYPARTGESAGRILTIKVNDEVYCSDRCDLLDIVIPDISGSTGSERTTVVSSESD